MAWKLVSTHIEQYTAGEEAHYVTRCFWQRTDGSVTTTFKDTGDGNEWHVGYDIPTPSDLYTAAGINREAAPDVGGDDD